MYVEVACALLVTAWSLKEWLRIRQYPPGPGYSLLGNIVVDSAERSERNSLDLQRKFGPISSQFILNRLAVYLNTMDAIKLAYVTHGDETAGRLSIRLPLDIGANAPGIVTAEGAVWQEHRRFALSALRTFGLGRNRAEEIILAELEAVISDFESQGSKAFDPRLSLNRATSSVISRLVFGQRAGREKEYDELYYKIRENIETVASNNLITVAFVSKFMRWLALPGTALRRGINQAKHNVGFVTDYVRTKLKEHEAVFDPHKEEQDLIDSFLLHRYQLETAQAQSEHSFTEEQLVRVVLELFVAGTETAATTIRWGIFLMVHHQDVQEKVQRELDDVLQGRMPSLVDRTRLPYTNAVYMEIVRYASVTPMGGPTHRCMSDLRLNGFLIPRGAVMFANIFAVHRDESIWPDAHNFNVANFLNDRNQIRNEQYLIPFNIGKRSCLGEGLAKQETFIFWCGLMQRFRFEKAGSDFPKETDSVFTNVIRFPQPFEIVAHVRDRYA